MMDDATKQAVEAFEKEFKRHCTEKNWEAVSDMFSRVTILSDIAKGMCEVDDIVMGMIFGGQE